MAVMVLLVALGMTAAFWWQARCESVSSAQKEFDSLSLDVAKRIDLRLAFYQHVLHSVQALYAASRRVTLDEFRQFVAAQNIEQRYPGMQDIALVQIVSGAEKSGMSL